MIELVIEPLPGTISLVAAGRAILFFGRARVSKSCLQRSPVVEKKWDAIAKAVRMAQEDIFLQANCRNDFVVAKIVANAR